MWGEKFAGCLGVPGFRVPIRRFASIRDLAGARLPGPDTTLGVYLVDLETMDLRIDDNVEMTFYWPAADRWEGTNFVICVD